MPPDNQNQNKNNDGRDEDRDNNARDSGEKSPGGSSNSGKHDNSDEENQDSGDTNDDGGKNGDDKKKSKPTIFQSIWFKIGLAIVVIVAIIAAVLWWLNARHYENTDDAFIDTHIIHIAPQIAGQVVRIYVNDNQRVRAGQPLVDIDSADATARLNQVQAQEAQAETQYYQALANKAGAVAQTRNANRDLARYRQLQRATPQAVAQQQVDQAVTAAKSNAAQQDAADAQIRGALAQIKVYKAQIAAAQLNLSYAHIVAPADGTVAQRSIAAGNYVTPGQELMAVVPLRVWVTANFKETQLEHMRIGQPVTLTVDACDKQIRGHIDSIQRGAGQAFGILPPENATGNYVKVVQRVPVKILLDKVPQGCVLGPGMSVEPTVKVR